MVRTKNTIWQIYGFAAVVSLMIALFVGWQLGFTALLTTLILAGIEISFSFDNAIINAKILQGMSTRWQRLFMTAGIIIAVFGVRLLLPFIMVAITSGLGLSSVINLALHHPATYSQHLTTAQPVIAAFGGMFLLMLFLDFIFQSQPVMWLVPIERRLIKLGKLESLSVIVAAVILLLSFLLLAHCHGTVLLAGLVGILLYLVINAFESAQHLTSPSGQITANRLVRGGLVGFLYLELIDASFSLDSVVGAFAITTNIILITAGLAIGALFVRSMTVHLLRKGTLSKYRYLNHGAHYAIGLLALLLLVSIRFALPDWLTGLSGITLIAIALVDSHWESQREVRNALLP